MQAGEEILCGKLPEHRRGELVGENHAEGQEIKRSQQGEAQLERKHCGNQCLQSVLINAQSCSLGSYTSGFRRMD